MESLQSLQVTTYSKIEPWHKSREVQANRGKGSETPLFSLC